jgi:hypothetical protein
LQYICDSQTDSGEITESAQNDVIDYCLLIEQVVAIFYVIRDNCLSKEAWVTIEGSTWWKAQNSSLKASKRSRISAVELSVYRSRALYPQQAKFVPSLSFSLARVFVKRIRNFV